MELLGLFEFIGTIAFAVSGALVGINKKLDFFGVMILAVTTAIGGGIIRDIIIGNTPPLAFINPRYCLVALISAITVWFFHQHLTKLSNIILIFDAVGLGAFTVNGAKIALASDYNSLFVVVSLGVLTGIGGGILRDMFAQEIPLIFRKEIYATASIIGATVLYYSKLVFSGELPLYLGFVTILFIRLLSMNLNLHLPVPKGNNSKTYKEL